VIPLRISALWIRIVGTTVAAAIVIAVAVAASAPAERAGTHRLTAEAAQLAELSPRQMAGQRVIFGYIGLRPPSRLLWLIRHGEVGGVVFFADNISSRAQIARVIDQLETANANSLNPVHSPLLLMVDQEGGAVRRLPGEPLLSEKQIGRSAHPATKAKAAGAGAARNLRGVGMNVDLAPVLDVYRQAGNFIDRYGRSYGMDPHTVANLGTAFVGALQTRGVAATAKHFPGLGAAARIQDTDTRPVTLNLSKTTLRSFDELPYKAAIAAGVKLVMVSWAVYPALDPKRPAGFSPPTVQGELRDRLGFGGVTITDSLAAGALRAYGSLKNRTLLAAKAGMDIMLGGGRTGEQCTDALESGYNNGVLNRTAFEAAVTRVLALRASLSN
jgi:beta-N-acetylhexosaminidase